MMFRQRGRLGCVAVLVASSLAAFPASVAVASPIVADVSTAGAVPILGVTKGTENESVGAPISTHQLTLITGDVVTLRTYADGRQAAEVDPIDPRAGFRQTMHNGHLSIIPAEAAGYLQAGLVDARLFDVTQLVADGYDDTRKASLPLIITYPSGRTPAKESLGRLSTAPRALRAVNGLAVAPAKTRLTQLWEQLDDDRPEVTAHAARPRLAGGVAKIWLDAPVRRTLDRSVPLIGAPEAWTAGYDGTGVKIAILDTGYDPTHPDLASVVTESANFSTAPDATDRDGHGTHVASTVAGSGAASGNRYRGVAPGARLLIGKVLGDAGWGQTSWAIAGMEWAVDRGAKVVNMSLGSDATDGTDPLSQTVNRLTAQSGTLFVVSAGNDGPDAGTIGAPGSADAALTVGNVDLQGQLHTTSSRGPRRGDGAIKPDLTAPGTGIVAARAANTFLGSPVSASYSALTGTSMAAPHAAGAAAILAQQHPDWPAADLKAALTSTAVGSTGLTVWEQGAGRVDVARAVRQSVTASTGSLSFGRYDWPHTGDDPVTKTVTYRNGGAVDVTLDLSLDVRSEYAEQAAGRAVTISDRQIVVPAGGERAVTVVVDVDGVDGVGKFGGWLTAKADEAEILRTSIGFGKDEQTFTVTVEGIARNGRPTLLPSGVDLFRMATGTSDSAWFASNGTARFQVPAGDYALMGFLFTMDEPGREEVEETLATIPDLHVDKDLTVRLDARTGVPVTVDVGRDVDPLIGSLSLRRTNGRDSLTVGFKPPTTVRALSATPTPAASIGTMEAYAKWELVAPRVRLTLASGRPTALDPYLIYASAPVDGSRRLAVADAGAGSPEELAAAAVSGKLALVRPSPTMTVPAQVSAAQDAGAVGLLLANDKPGVLDPSAGSRVRIPVIGLSQIDGDRIRAALGSDRSTRLNLSGTDPRHSPFLYDLVKPWPGQIPDSLRYRVGSDDVATLPTDYAASYPGQPGRELRHHWRPGAVASIAYGRDLILPLHRVDYVSASDSVWQQTVRLAPPSSAELVETTRGYPRGQREQRSWFKGPIAAGPQSGAPARPERGTPVNRRDNTLFVSMPEFRDSDPTHAGDFQSWIDTGRATIRRDGVEIHTGSTLDGKYVVPAETGTYEFELDVSRDGDFWRTSTRSHTRWTLRSGRPATLDPVPLPLVDARVSVPVDSLNRVPGLATIPVAVTAGHQAGAPTVALREVTLAVSDDDGVTWRNVRLAKQKDGRYQALLHLPGSGFGTLRVSAIDVEGNAFDQTIYRSYEIVPPPE